MKKWSLAHETDGLPQEVVRQISLLKQLGPHANVVRLIDQFHLANHANQLSAPVVWLCFESCQSDLKDYMKAQKYQLSAATVQSLAHQMLTGVAWCHAHRVLHRDLQPRNLLVDARRGQLKLGDFDLARAVEAAPGRAYTLPVVTIWYRAPELLLGDSRYTGAIDVWSVGCVLAEMTNGHPLFPSVSEIDALFQIFHRLGTPDEAA